ncbi:MAG: hypothetical protein ABL895_02905 [Cyclobacteriaceae bacterium]
MLKTFAALMLFACCANAQTNYLITSKADTLYGKVRILSYDLMDRVQLEAGKKKETFTALQVLSVSIDSQLYKPVKYENKILLMKLLKSGYLSLYAFQMENQTRYDGRFLLKLDGTGTEVPNLSFKKFMENFLKDCNTIALKIKSGELTRKDINKIIDEYNTCMKNQVTTPPVVEGNETLLAIESMIKKIEAEEFPSKKDALDLLRDIQGKVSKNESVPNYLTEGLKSYLSNVPSLTEDLNKLFGLLQK